MDKPKPKRRVYKPMRFGEGMQPGTVEAKMVRRRLRKEQRTDDRLWAELEATREAEAEPLRGHLTLVLDHVKICSSPSLSATFNRNPNLSGWCAGQSLKEQWYGRNFAE